MTSGRAWRELPSKYRFRAGMHVGPDSRYDDRSRKMRAVEDGGEGKIRAAERGRARPRSLHHQ